MAIIEFKDVPVLVQDLLAGRKKAISYGLSFETRRQFMLPVKYAINVREGTPEHPLIKPITALRDENPESTVILNCIYPIEEAWQQIEPFGNFTVLNYFTLDYIQGFLPALTQLPLSYRREPKQTTARRGIVIRGAFMGTQGIHAIQKFAADHPHDYIVVSTWDALSLGDTKALEEICDRLVVNPRPRHMDAWNINVQIACIQPGIRALQEVGVERILVIRSDFFFANPFMLDHFDALLDSHPSHVAAAHGLKGRLIIPDLDTRKYCPYHASDMLTYGWAEDVAKFWLPIEENTDNFSKSVYETHGKENIKFMSQQYPVIETIFGLSFMKQLKRAVTWTLADSLTYYRDFFVIVGHVENGMFWFKRAWYDRVKFVGKHAEYVTPSVWAAMTTGRRIEDFAEIDIQTATWDNYLDDM